MKALQRYRKPGWKFIQETPEASGEAITTNTKSMFHCNLFDGEVLMNLRNMIANHRQDKKLVKILKITKNSPFCSMKFLQQILGIAIQSVFMLQPTPVSQQFHPQLISDANYSTALISIRIILRSILRLRRRNKLLSGKIRIVVECPSVIDNSISIMLDICE